MTRVDVKITSDQPIEKNSGLYYTPERRSQK